MADGYFTDDQNNKMKSMLYPYLMDKAKRRAAQTSGDAYQAREGGYATDAENARQRGLVSVLGDSASMAGTLEGRRSDIGLLPKYMDQLNDADQQRNANMFKERGAEDQALGTDLSIAKFIGDTDYRDKDLKARSFDREEDRKARLQGYLEAEKAKREAAAQQDKQFMLNYGQRERLGNEGMRLREKAIDKPTNPAMQGPGGIVPGYTDAAGNPITYNPKTGVQGSLKLPPGAKTTKTGTASPEDKANQKIAQDYSTQAAKSDGVANMIDSGVKQIEAYKAAGNKSQAVAAARNMIKDLNSTFGADAIGAEEQKRLAAYLENFRYDVLGGNYGIGPDIDAFIEQAKGKAQAVHRGAATNFSKAKDIRANGLQIGGEAPPVSAGAPPPQGLDPTQMPDDQLKAEYERLKAKGHIK